MEPANRQETGRNPDGTFKKGVSGNPNGRPRNPIKEHSAKRFEEMTEEEKDKFLAQIPPAERWRMTEGNPHQTVDSKVEGELNINLINYGHLNNPISIPTEGLSAPAPSGTAEIQDSSVPPESGQK